MLAVCGLDGFVRSILHDQNQLPVYSVFQIYLLLGSLFQNNLFTVSSQLQAFLVYVFNIYFIFSKL